MTLVKNNIVAEPVVCSVTRTERGMVLELCIPPDLCWFEGHFPEAAILPGVVQLDWVILFCNRYLALTLEAAQTFQVKFRQIFGPGDGIFLHIEQRSNETVRFEYRKENEILSSGVLKLT